MPRPERVDSFILVGPGGALAKLVYKLTERPAIGERCFALQATWRRQCGSQRGQRRTTHLVPKIEADTETGFGPFAATIVLLLCHSVKPALEVSVSENMCSRAQNGQGESPSRQIEGLPCADAHAQRRERMREARVARIPGRVRRRERIDHDPGLREG